MQSYCRNIVTNLFTSFSQYPGRLLIKTRFIQPSCVSVRGEVKNAA